MKALVNTHAVTTNQSSLYPSCVYAHMHTFAEICVLSRGEEEGKNQ